MAKRWIKGMCKEFGRVFQGYKCPDGEHDTVGTNTCKFIKRGDIPQGKTPTYVRVVTMYREQKADPFRVRLTVGGNLIKFPGDVSTKQIADILTAKMLINSIISTPGARAAAIDLKDFYLENDLPNKEYIRIPLLYVPQDIIDQYNLTEFIEDGAVYAEISKGMYGLPQAGIVAENFLLPRLAEAGYHPTGRTPGLFKHVSNSITFALVVDDFLIKYTDIKDLHHLTDTLKQNYELTMDTKAEKYCGMQINWNYEKGYVDISMPGYVNKALQRFTHPMPATPQPAPSAWVAPQYGASIQYAEPEDTSNKLSKQGILRLQEIVGTFLYYGRAVDNTMLVALGTLSSAQSQGTEATMDAAIQLLNYTASNPDAVVRYYASEMVLYVHSDASYLSEPKARSRVGGFFYLGNKNEPNNNPHPNGPIHIESKIMKNVMSSAAEAKTGALFHNRQECSPSPKHPQRARPRTTRTNPTHHRQLHS